MGIRANAYFFLMLAVGFTVYSQLILKWQMKDAISMNTVPHITKLLVMLVTNPWLLSAFFAAFLTAMVWMIVLANLDLSYAYPLFIGILFVCLNVLGFILFKEDVNCTRVFSLLLIIAGIIIGTR